MDEQKKWVLHNSREYNGSFSDTPESEDKYKTMQFLKAAYRYVETRDEYNQSKGDVLGLIYQERTWLYKRRPKKRTLQFVISHAAFLILSGMIIYRIISLIKFPYNEVEEYWVFITLLWIASIIVSFIFFIKFLVAVIGRKTHLRNLKEHEDLYEGVHDEFQNMIDHDETIKPSSEIFVWMFPNLQASGNQITVMYNALKEGKARNFKEALLYYDEYKHRKFMEEEARIQTENTRIAAENARKAAENTPTIIHRTVYR